MTTWTNADTVTDLWSAATTPATEWNDVDGALLGYFILNEDHLDEARTYPATWSDV